MCFSGAAFGIIIGIVAFIAHIIRKIIGEEKFDNFIMPSSDDDI